MTSKLLAALACLGFAAQAGAEVNFDKGVDIKGAIEQARGSELKAPYPYYGPQRVRFSRECKSFNFGPSDLPLSSDREFLSSTEYIEECRFVANPPPPPPAPPVNPNVPKPPRPGQNKDYYPGQPGYGQPYYPGQSGYPYGSNDYGPHGNYSYPGSFGNQQGTWYCHERPGRVYRATAQLNVGARQLYPWERESFEVCMEADRVDLAQRSTPYSYSLRRDGYYDVTFDLTPGYRRPTAPDAAGLYETGWAFRDGKFVLSVGDKWTQYYNGEKVAIKVELIKDGFLFFNSSQGVKEFTFDVGSSYELAFAEEDLQKTADFVDTSSDYRGPKKYFVKWGFKRLGSVSTQEYVKKGDTGKITK